MQARLLILSFLFIAVQAFAQDTIPNASFEHWHVSSKGYTEPDGWISFNEQSYSLHTFSCSKGSPGSAGNCFMKLVSKRDSATQKILIPPYAQSGNPLGSNLGFAYSKRPTSLTWKWQYLDHGGVAQGIVYVDLTRWNKSKNRRDTIGSGSLQPVGIKNTWVSASITIDYTLSGNPDTATIGFLGNTYKDDYIYVDDLAFTGVSSVAGETKTISAFKVYPNPSLMGEDIRISFSSNLADLYTISVSDINGRVVARRTVNSIDGINEEIISTYGMPAGLYFIQLCGKEGIESRKVIIGRTL